MDRDFRLFADNLMRPLAIPTAGGFVSALLLFGCACSRRLRHAARCPATMSRPFCTPRLRFAHSSRSGFYNEDITIEVTIDGDGRVIDYSLPNGASEKSRASSEHRELSVVYAVHSRTKLRSAREGEGADLVPEQPHRSKGLNRLEWPDAASVSISLQTVRFFNE